MTFEVKVYVGIGQDKDHNPISPERQKDALERIRYEAASEFGGYTEYAHRGGWFDFPQPHNAVLVSEPGVTFAVIVGPEKLAAARSFAEFVKRKLKQTSVLFTVSAVESEFV